MKTAMENGENRYSGLRIALTGPGGSGKTTLAKELSVRLGLPLIDESTRKAAAMLGYKVREVPRQVIPAFQVLAATLQVEAEKACVVTGFVSDRSIYDYRYYASDVHGFESLGEYLEDEFIICEEDVFLRGRVLFGLYDRLYLVSSFANRPVDDGERLMSEEMINAQELMFEDGSDFRDLVDVVVEAKGVDERAECVIADLEKYLEERRSAWPELSAAG